VVRASNNAQFADKVRRTGLRTYAPAGAPDASWVSKELPRIQFRQRPRANESAWRSCKETLACKRSARGLTSSERTRARAPASAYSDALHMMRQMCNTKYSRLNCEVCARRTRRSDKGLQTSPIIDRVLPNNPITSCSETPQSEPPSGDSEPSKCKSI